MAIYTNNVIPSVQRTPGFISATTAGSIPAGAKSIYILNSGSKTGTVAGSNLVAGTAISFDATNQDTFAALAYDPTKDSTGAATGTTFIITTFS